MASDGREELDELPRDRVGVREDAEVAGVRDLRVARAGDALDGDGDRLSRHAARQRPVSFCRGRVHRSTRARTGPRASELR